MWLGSPPEEWRQKYNGWKSLEKSWKYIHAVMQEVAGTKPAVTKGRRSYEASKLRQTLARYYTQPEEPLRRRFSGFSTTPICGPSSMQRRTRRRIRCQDDAQTFESRWIASIVQWTGQLKIYREHAGVRKLIQRCQELKLLAPREPVRLQFELAAYLATLVTNHLVHRQICKEVRVDRRRFWFCSTSLSEPIRKRSLLPSLCGNQLKAH